MLSYALFSHELYEQIVEDMRDAIQPDGTIDLPTLMDKSTHLDSLWNEVLRLTNSSSAVRTVMDPTQIGGKTLRPGFKVMSPFRQLHFDENVFGHDAQECNPYRFLKDKSLHKHQSYRPFGGGATFCPGRFIARQEVFIFVALAVHRFRIKLAPVTNGHPQTFPKLEVKKPTTGIMSPQQNEDLIILAKEVSMAQPSS